MSDREVFQLQNEIEKLKQQRTMRIPPVTPLLAFGLMAAGIALSFLGLPELGYKIALAGFVGFVILYGVQRYLRRQAQNTAFRIQELERRIEALRRQ